MQDAALTAVLQNLGAAITDKNLLQLSHARASEQRNVTTREGELSSPCAQTHGPLPELYSVARPCTASFYALAFVRLLFVVRDLRPRSSRVSFGRAGDIPFPWKMNCTSSGFLFPRLICLDAEHSHLAFLAWRAGVAALQHLPAKNRCYFGPGLTLHAPSRAAQVWGHARAHPAATERHPWATPGTSLLAPVASVFRGAGGHEELAWPSLLCFQGPGCLLRTGVCNPAPGKAVSGTRTSTEQGFCV